MRSFVLTGLIPNLPTGSMKWRLNLHSIEQNVSKFKDFPDFQSEKYTGPSLFIGGENSPYIRYAATVLEIISSNCQYSSHFTSLSE